MVLKESTMTNIYQKLSKAQKEMPSFEKDATNPHFKSKFASLPKILSKALPVLRENGLLLTNHAIVVDGSSFVQVKITDIESQESIVSNVPMQKIDNMQLVGQAFTYAQRYGFLSLMGLCPDVDDDGEGLNGRGDNAVNDNQQSNTDMVKQSLELLEVKSNPIISAFGQETYDKALAAINSGQHEQIKKAFDWLKSL